MTFAPIKIQDMQDLPITLVVATRSGFLYSGYLNATIATTAVCTSIAFVKFGTQWHFPERLRTLAVGWNIASLLLSLWTAIVLVETWRFAQQASVALFTLFDLAFLLLVTLTLAALNIYS